MVEYEVFKKEVLDGLMKICGNNARIRIERILKNNGKHYDGVQIRVDGISGRVCPVVPLEWFYEVYCDGGMNIAGCVRTIHKISETGREEKEVLELAGRVMDWEHVKRNIYPILLSTKENQEMLREIVSNSMLDLSVGYIIRAEMDSRCVSIKINYRMLESYGVSVGQLHRQALENLASDGYRFHNMRSFIIDLGCDVSDEPELEKIEPSEELYILTNDVKFYGAAGILDRKLIREFADGRNFYILPSSIHETILVPADDRVDVESYNYIVKIVNKKFLDIEERLADHAYFYDAVADEIRECS
ncbi:MAG: hypothetical protein HDR09_07395 [Lachnospiraceae bacterium]|nr:hypothetical protein [Lachnospiraceae bacterium]